MKVKTFRLKPVRVARIDPTPSHLSIEPEGEEILTGTVQGKEASAPEERFAKALSKAGVQYIFRHIFGAPKGLPGWKELDFIVSSNGLVYAYEVDTAFTHRNKQYKDRLHDALILSDQEIQTMGTVYPVVFHASGDSDLSTEESARKYVKQQFGR